MNPMNPKHPILPHPAGYAIAAVITAALGILFFLRVKKSH